MTIASTARFALPAIAFAALASAAVAKPEDTRVLAHSSPVATWRAAVSRDISDNLVLPRPSISAAPEGIVKVSFRTDATGAPEALGVLQSSGSADLDRAALFAVRRVRTLGDAPAGIDSSRPLQAWIYFANTDAVADRFSRELHDEATADMSAGGDAPLMATAR